MLASWSTKATPPSTGSSGDTMSSKENVAAAVTPPGIPSVLKSVSSPLPAVMKNTRPPLATSGTSAPPKLQLRWKAVIGSAVAGSAVPAHRSLLRSSQAWNSTRSPSAVRLRGFEVAAPGAASTASSTMPGAGLDHSSRPYGASAAANQARSPATTTCTSEPKA